MATFQDLGMVRGTHRDLGPREAEVIWWPVMKIDTRELVSSTKSTGGQWTAWMARTVVLSSGMSGADTYTHSRGM